MTLSTTPTQHEAEAREWLEAEMRAAERVNRRGDVEMCKFILTALQSRDAEVERWKRIAVELAVPLESLRMVGGNGYFPPNVETEIVRVTNIIRQALSNGDQP